VSDLSNQQNTTAKTLGSEQARAAEPQIRTQGETAALLKILQLDADLRRIETERELIYYLGSESRAVLG